MGFVEIAILYHPSEGRGPLDIARTRDPRAVFAAKKAVLRETEARAAELTEVEPGLAAIEEAEACKLRRILALLVPGPTET